MSVARKKVLPMVLPTPPATTPTAVTPAPSLTATPTLHATTVPQVATAPVSTTTTNLPIQPAPPQLVPIKPLPQPIPAQLITQKIQPAPMLQTMPKPIQPNTATTSTSTHTLQSTFQTVQTMNFQVNGGAPQTIAPSQLLPSPALGAQTPQTQKQLRGAQKSKTQQAQTTAQKPRKQKQTKRAVKRVCIFFVFSLLPPFFHAWKISLIILYAKYNRHLPLRQRLSRYSQDQPKAVLKSRQKKSNLYVNKMMLSCFFPR